MKYKLLIHPSLLKPPYTHTLSRTLLVIPSDKTSQITTVKDLLAFAYGTFSFALSCQSQDLFLSTDDDFLLPPNAQVRDALDQGQVIKMDSIGRGHGEQGLYNIPRNPEAVPKVVEKKPVEKEVQKKEEVKKEEKPKNRRKEKKKGKLIGKRTVLEIKSASESSSSESSSESESSSDIDSVPEKETKKKTKKPDLKQNVIAKIRGEFKQAFKAADLQPQQPIAQQKPVEKVSTLQEVSKSIVRPYLNQFDHLLPSKQQVPPQKPPPAKQQQYKQAQQQKSVKFNPVTQTKTIPPQPAVEQSQLKCKTTVELYDSLFDTTDNKEEDGEVVDYDEEQDPGERRRWTKEERKQKLKEWKQDDESLYNKYTEVYTKDSKRDKKISESIFTSGGILELMNQKNQLVIINLDSYIYLSPEILKQLSSEAYSSLFKVNSLICFRLTEPCLQTFVPKVSEAKLGTIHSLEGSALQIQLRQDFTLLDPEEDAQMMMAQPGAYLGEGLYKVQLTDLVGVYIKEEDTSKRNEMSKLIPQSPSKAQKQTSNGTPASAEFLQSQQENIDKSIRRQVEYYFSDTNFPKDKYLQKKCTENPEGFISLRDIMSFNQMRKLTQSWEQVVRALEGSTVVEFSPDFRLIRKKQA